MARFEPESAGVIEGKKHGILSRDSSVQRRNERVGKSNYYLDNTGEMNRRYIDESEQGGGNQGDTGSLYGGRNEYSVNSTLLLNLQQNNHNNNNNYQSGQNMPDQKVIEMQQ